MKDANTKAVYIITAFFTIIVVFFFSANFLNQNRVLRQVIARLEADSRIAEVLVTGVSYNEEKGERFTTIKFLEYDVKGKPLTPKYFTFSGNIIQFQSLVIRFEDIHIARSSKLRSKSAFFFWKVFMLDGAKTQEYAITETKGVPDGYRIAERNSPFEQRLWKNFWKYALDQKEAKKMGIKNAQIEAPGTVFIPGMLYTIKIEHDGGIRIDSSPLPAIVRGENIL
jgi:hypothetical protein